MKKKKKNFLEGKYSSEFIAKTRVMCKCGHSISFISNTPYVECSHCHDLVFKNKKCEYDYRIKRRFIK